MGGTWLIVRRRMVTRRFLCAIRAKELPADARRRPLCCPLRPTVALRMTTAARPRFPRMGAMWRSVPRQPIWSKMRPRATKFICGTRVQGAEGSCSASTQIVSIDSNGALTGTESLLPSISASGRFVAFLAVTQSHAPQQPGVASGANNSGYRQVFVRDTCLGVSSCTPKTSRISLQPGDGTSTTANTAAKRAGPAIGANGRASHLRGKRRRFLRVRWPLTIAFFWRLQNPTNSLQRARNVKRARKERSCPKGRHASIRSLFNAAAIRKFAVGVAYWPVDLVKRNKEMEVPLGLSDSETMRTCRPRSARNATSPSETRTSRKISGRGFSPPS